MATLTTIYIISIQTPIISDRGRDRGAAVAGEEDLDGVGRVGGDRRGQADGRGPHHHAVG